MRAHIRGIGVVFGLAVALFGSPAAWANSVANGAANEAVKEAANINETADVTESGSFLAAQGDPDPQSVQPREAPESGDGGQDADGGAHLSVSLLALGMALGAAAGAGAIVWREVRR